MSREDSKGARAHLKVTSRWLVTTTAGGWPTWNERSEWKAPNPLLPTTFRNK